MTTIHLEKLQMPGVRLGEENPLPLFRDRSSNRTIGFDSSIPQAKRSRLGWETGFRVLPYRMQDNYTRQRVLTTYTAVVLENEFLIATFLPELGGRLVSLVYKPSNRELLCRNPVFQPANLAIRNAWFSGGIEWNIGQLGHTFSTCSPIFAASIIGMSGEPGLRLYEFERCKQLFWQIDFYLPPGSPWLLAYTRILNPNDFDSSVYWWTNIAVSENQDLRVLAPARTAIYADLSKKNDDLALAELPYLPTLSGKDATYAQNAEFANEFFFQCDDTDLPWEAALDKAGSGLIEASTPRLRYRKLFCWGSHQGGRHWQDFLAPGGTPYIEIQAGLAPTQLHGMNMPAHAIWDWTQIFGFCEMDPAKVHGTDWNDAWRSVDGMLRKDMPAGKLLHIESTCRELADTPPTEILSHGSGWGALELERRASFADAVPVPASFVFPASSMGVEQAKWLHLLKYGCLNEQSPALAPGEWMVQKEFSTLLEKSLTKEANRNWFSLLHLGVMRMENFDDLGAKSAWQELIQKNPSAWAYRNLAVLATINGNRSDALVCFEHAWELNAPSVQYTLALAQEYLQALCADRRYLQAEQTYAKLPRELQWSDRIQILHARIALELGDLDPVDKILRHEFAVIREGETELTDIWFELIYRRYVASNDLPLDEKTRQEIRLSHQPPLHIDFRSVNR